MNWEQLQDHTVNGVFRLKEFLGGSESSAVFLTEGSEAPKLAIKLIPAVVSNAATQLERWKLVAELSHPHLLRIFDSGRCRLGEVDMLFVVMEFAEENLSQILPSRALTVEELRELLPPVLDVLDYLNEKGFAHGALKPGNIMATGDQVKLSSDNVLRTGDALLSIGPQSAPESTQGVMPASDLWALGYTLVEVLSQRPPIWRPNETLPELPHNLPEQFRVIAQHCLIRDPKLRCKTADIRQRLQPVQQDVVPSALQAEALVRQAPSAKRMVIAASMAAAVIAAAVAIPRLKEHSDEPKGAALPTPTYSAPTPQTVPPPTIMSEATQPVPATPVAAPTTAPIPVLMHPSLAGEKRLGPDSPALAPPPRHASVHVSEPASAPNEGEQAGIVRRVLPNVPRKALSTISGTIRVHITVTVGQEGNVSAAEFGSIGPSRYFANYAMDAAKQWRFSPSDSGLRAWNLQFDFKRSGVDVVASQAAR